MEIILLIVGLVVIVSVLSHVLRLIEGPPPPPQRFSKYTGEPDEEFKREVEEEEASLLSLAKKQEIKGPSPPTKRFSKYTGEPDEEFRREVEGEEAFVSSVIEKLDIERELKTGLKPKQFGLAGLLILMTVVAIVLGIWKLLN